jgi:rubrerythrin
VAEIPAMDVGARIEATLAAQPSQPREKGHHPSSMARFCPVYQLRIDAINAKPVVERSADDVRALEVHAANALFDGHTHAIFAAGHSAHERLQYQAGLAQMQVGEWNCAECGHTHGEYQWADGAFQFDSCVLMPTKPVTGNLGLPTRAPAECPKCGKNLKHNVPWRYVEPRIQVPELDIVGHCDGIYRLRWRGKLMHAVVDYKTASANSIAAGIPKDEHVTQLNVYGFALRADFGLLVYENKDSNRLITKEVSFSFDRELVLPYMRVAAYRSGSMDAAMGCKLCDTARSDRATKCPFRADCFKE